MSDLLTNKFIAGAIAGVISSAVVDFQAFRSWKNAQEALEYDWAVAGWRWFQGAVLGAMTAAGIAGLV